MRTLYLYIVYHSIEPTDTFYTAISVDGEILKKEKDG